MRLLFRDLSKMITSGRVALASERSRAWPKNLRMCVMLRSPCSGPFPETPGCAGAWPIRMRSLSARWRSLWPVTNYIIARSWKSATSQPYRAPEYVIPIECAHDRYNDYGTTDPCVRVATRAYGASPLPRSFLWTEHWFVVG